MNWLHAAAQAAFSRSAVYLLRLRSERRPDARQARHAPPKLEHLVVEIRAEGVPARGRFDRGVEREAGIVAGVVHRQLLAAGLHCEPFRPTANARRGGATAVGQQVANPFAADHQIEQRQDRRAVPPGQRQPARVFLADQAVLVALDGEGHRPARRNRIHPRPVQHLVGGEDALQILVQQQAAERQDRLILRLVRFGVTPSETRQPAAADRASVAVIFDRLARRM